MTALHIINTVSEIIPTYNEEKALPATLSNLFRQAGLYEVIGGGSTDRTREIAEANPRLRFETSPKGRARQMNAAARLAGGEWLLFLHDDTAEKRVESPVIRLENGGKTVLWVMWSEKRHFSRPFSTSAAVACEKNKKR